MAKTHVVYVIEKDGKRAAFVGTIGFGYNLSTWLNEHEAKFAYIYPKLKECEEIAEQWNQGYINQGKYLYPVK